MIFCKMGIRKLVFVQNYNTAFKWREHSQDKKVSCSLDNFDNYFIYFFTTFKYKLCLAWEKWSQGEKDLLQLQNT